jgi:hypothetical protein
MQDGLVVNEKLKMVKVFVSMDLILHLMQMDEV